MSSEQHKVHDILMSDILSGCTGHKKKQKKNMHMKPNNKVQVVIQISENEIPRSHLLNFVQTLVGNVLSQKYTAQDNQKSGGVGGKVCSSNSNKNG